MSQREHFTLRPATEQITDTVSKMGGQPVWLEQPQWPLSRDTGEPMWFIAQFAVPAGLAYVFMTDATEYVDYAAEAEGGENAVIVQRGGRLPVLQRSIRESARVIDVTASRSGPTVAAIDHILVPSAAANPVTRYQFLGGEPSWLQGDESPGEGYWLAAQFDSEVLPFPVNLGDLGDLGKGYVFVCADGVEGRFLWQNH